VGWAAQSFPETQDLLWPTKPHLLEQIFGPLLVSPGASAELFLGRQGWKLTRLFPHAPLRKPVEFQTTAHPPAKVRARWSETASRNQQLRRVAFGIVLARWERASLQPPGSPEKMSGTGTPVLVWVTENGHHTPGLRLVGVELRPPTLGFRVRETTHFEPKKTCERTEIHHGSSKRKRTPSPQEHSLGLLRRLCHLILFGLQTLLSFWDRRQRNNY
jgi:hypothetical protein